METGSLDLDVKDGGKDGGMAILEHLSMVVLSDFSDFCLL